MKTIAFTLILITFAFGGCTNTPSNDESHDHHAGASAQAEEYYTCPMHPSVRSDRPGACPVCNMALVKKTAQKDLSTEDRASLLAVSLSPTQRVMANVTTIPAARRAMRRDIQAVGLISYAEPNYKHISARFPGRLEKLYISYTGQSVRKGDPVAEVYSPEAISAQQEYLLALDSYEQASKGGQSFTSYAEQLLEQAEEKLRQWGFTKNQLSRLRDTRKLNYVVTIYSPISGIVVKKSVDPQHYASTGEDMFDVADLSVVWIYLDVYERDIRFISRGLPVEITTEAYPGEVFKGKVLFVDPVLNPETRTIRVRTEFANPNLRLKPNMYATAKIIIPKADALVVPSTAVISTGKRSVVWIEVHENAFEPREVVTGAVNDGLTQILDGLREGENVVVTGGYLIDSESALLQPAASALHEGHGTTKGPGEVPPPASDAIRIHVKDGYHPSEIRVKAGKKVKLEFYRDETSMCSDEIMINKFGIKKKLPAYQITTVELTPKESGEVVFTCGMEMLHGKLIVEPR